MWAGKLIELMNQVRDLEGQEIREIRRILRELTAALAPHAERIHDAFDALVDFDALSARARAPTATRVARLNPAVRTWRRSSIGSPHFLRDSA